MTDSQRDPTAPSDAVLSGQNDVSAPSHAAVPVVSESPEAPDDMPTVISRMATRAPRPEEKFLGQLRGRRLAHFEMSEALGVGGMAAVIQARDTHLDREVALKILPPEIAADAENVRRFQQEARAAAKLNHENVASVFYYGEDQGLHFIAFEFVEGEDLRAIIQRTGRLPVAEAVGYVLQIARGLAHSSSRGVIHRDVKPSNIIITVSGRAKLVDMGLARYQETQAEKALTHSGVTLGTFDYISPEQAIEPREVDVRSDIYSLGCTFYHMVTGRPSVPEGTAAKKLHHHQHVLPIDPRQHNDEIPDDVAAVLAHMMAKDPKDRYQTAEELLRDLSRVAAGSSGGRSTETHEPLGFPIGARHRWRPVMLGAVAAGALFGLVTIHELSSNVAPHRTLTSMPPLANSPADKPSLPQATVASNAKHAESAPPVTATFDFSAARNLLNGLREWGSVFTNPPTSAEARKPASSASRIVDPTVRGIVGETYETLPMAIASAKPGDVILIKAQELRVDPLVLNKKSMSDVTVRAHPGYRPLLTLGDSADRESALFRLHDGKLAFEGLEFKLRPDRDEFTTQAIVDIVGEGQCTFKDCVITLDDTRGKSLALATLGDSSRVMKTDTASALPQVPILSLEDCFVRGQGDVISVRSARAVELRMENTLVAVTGTVVDVEAGAGEGSPPPQIPIRLTRVTTYIGGNLVRLRTLTPGKEPLTVQVNPAIGCLFASADGKPLVQLIGMEASTEQMKSLFSWEGGRQNAYSKFPAMLDQIPHGDEMPRPPFDQNWWRNFTGETDAFFPTAAVKFAAPPDTPLGESLLTVIPARFKVRPDSSLQNVGADVERLPRPGSISDATAASAPEG